MVTFTMAVVGDAVQIAAQALLPRRVARAMSGTGLEFTTSDGVRLVYDDEGSGEPFLLVHGYACRRGHWEYQRDALLAAGYRVVALDLRGFGESARPDHGLCMARLGQDLRELMEHLDLRGTNLVGHSMGANIGLSMFTVSGFDRVRRFVAIDQSPKIINDETWHWGVRGIGWDNLQDALHWRIDWLNEELEPQMPADSQMGQERFDLFDHAPVFKLLQDHMCADWRDTLPRVSIPTWVVTSRHTTYYDIDGMRWYAEQVPDARLSVFENSGHNIHVSEADEFNRQLLEFVQVT